MRRIKLPSSLFKILVEQNTDNFTALQLRDACEQLSPVEASNKSEAYKAVYRQLTKLKRNGVISSSRHQGQVHYVKTDKFKPEIFYCSKLPAHNVEEHLVKKSNIQSELVNKLKEYEVEMLSAIGESDEYKALYSSYPELKAQLEAQYLIARERSSKVLGQITAIKKVIKDLHPT